MTGTYFSRIFIAALHANHVIPGFICCRCHIFHAFLQRRRKSEKRNIFGQVFTNGCHPWPDQTHSQRHLQLTIHEINARFFHLHICYCHCHCCCCALRLLGFECCSLFVSFRFHFFLLRFYDYCCYSIFSCLCYTISFICNWNIYAMRYICALCKCVLFLYDQFAFLASGRWWCCCYCCWLLLFSKERKRKRFMYVLVE